MVARGNEFDVCLCTEKVKNLLRFSLGVTRMDRIRNKHVRRTAQVACFGDKGREARLRWFGDGYIGRNMVEMEMPGKRSRGRTKRRYMDV